MKSLFLEVRPEPINVGNVEDQPPPLGRAGAVFQIEDRVFRIFRAERGKIPIFFPVAQGRALKAAALRIQRLVPCSDRALSRFAIVIFQQSTQSLPTACRAFFRTHSLSVSRK